MNYVMSLYLPSGTNSARLGYKFLFMDDFQNYITDLKKEIPNLVICGDYNIHEAIDIHNPVQSKKVSGFCQKKELGLMGFSIVDSLIVSVFK
jgi:exodeoxyribonuclease-3